MKKLQCGLGLIIIAILVNTTACLPDQVQPISPVPTYAPDELALSFETIKADTGGDTETSYWEATPRLVMVNSLEDIDHLVKLVRPEILAHLQTLDFNQYFAVAVFQGRKATGGYRTTIKRVAVRDDELRVYAQFREPSPNEVVTLAETSPFHLVKVKREAGMDQPAKAVLVSWVVISALHAQP